MRISIFYASKDLDARNRIIRILKNDLEYKDVWTADDITAGEDYEAAINARIQETQVAILLMSPSVLESQPVVDFEWPLIKPRVDAGKASLIPIVVEFVDVHKIEKIFGKLQLVFRKEGSIVPFNEHHFSAPEQTDYLRAAVKLPRIRTRSKSSGLIPIPSSIPITSHTLITPPVDPPLIECGSIGHLDLIAFNGRLKATEIIQQDYADCPDRCIRSAVDGYLRLRKAPGGAKLALRWGSELSEKLSAQVIHNPIHREILELLKNGLPVSPVHLENFAPKELNVNLIMTEGIASLLHGLQILESDPSRAAEVIGKRARRDCALAQCALGQCYRRLDALGEAAFHLNLAEKYADGMDLHCSCGLNCPKNSILAEAHRGLGTLRRKQGDFVDADNHFKLALEACAAGGVSPNQEGGVRYSYGYFEFERGVSCYDGTERGAEGVRKVMREGFDPRSGPSSRALELFRSALVKFAEDERLRPNAGPSASRKAIVCQLLGVPCLEELYIVGRKQPGAGVEQVLTEFFCAVALFLLDENPVKKKMVETAKMLENLFLGDRLVADGPRQCAAFDLQVIIGGLDVKKLDSRLVRAIRLLIASTSWDLSDGLGRQHSLTRAFLKDNPIRTRPSASP